MSEIHTRIVAAREALSPPAPRAAGIWSLLGATTLAATAAVLLAGVMVLGPGISLSEPAVASRPMT